MRPELTALLALADEKLRAAGLLVAGEAWGDASSRAYYAAFHAVSAALLSRGETYSRHGQVLGAFKRAFVHTGLLPREFTFRALLEVWFSRYPASVHTDLCRRFRFPDDTLPGRGDYYRVSPHPTWRGGNATPRQAESLSSS